MFWVAGSWGQSGAGSRWFEAGAASAERIASGQWWRAVTALTLHADLLHLAGNVVAALIFVAAVGRWLGGGLGALVLLSTAAAANLLTAAVHRTAFVSVGASTATFAALGLCAGLQVVRRLRGGARRKYAWVPLGAGLGLYAMLGVGPGADTYAHLFGLGLGAAIGSAAAFGNVRAPRTMVQVLLGAVALAAIGASWALGPPRDSLSEGGVGELDGEDRAGAGRALHADGAAEHVDDLLDDPEPEADPPEVPAVGGALEPAEDPLLVAGRDAEPLIADDEPRVSPLRLDADVDRFAVPVLDRVRDQIRHDLLEPLAIPVSDRRAPARRWSACCRGAPPRR